MCNDEGKLNGMELNRGIYGDDGEHGYYRGPFLSAIAPAVPLGAFPTSRLNDIPSSLNILNASSKWVMRSKLYHMNPDSKLSRREHKPKLKSARGLWFFLSKHRPLGTKVNLLG